MPYNSVKELPDHIKKYPDKIARQWMHVFNTVYDKKINEGASKEEAEKAAFKAANSVVNENLSKNTVHRYGYEADINNLIDEFLGNWRINYE